MAREFLTDEAVEEEILRLQSSPQVKLARREEAIRNRRRQYMYQLRMYEKKGQALEAQGITLEELEEIALPCPGTIVLENIGVRICCEPAVCVVDTADAFTIIPKGQIVIRSRQAGDRIRLYAGKKKKKKLFIDRKIPAIRRTQIPVLSDDTGVLGVYGVGVSRERLAFDENAVLIRFESI